MTVHPQLRNPNAVLISRTPVGEPVTWTDFHRAAVQVLTAMRIGLEGEHVVLKPNLSSGEAFADPDTGITTHPGFVQGMLEYLRAHGMDAGRSCILEDPRNSDDDEPRHWKGTGFPEVAQATGVGLRTPTTTTCVGKTVPRPHAFAALNVSRLAVSPDTILFNVPKLRTHPLNITTLCLKNLMGTVNAPDRHFCGQAWQEFPPEVRDDRRPRREWVDESLHERWQAGLARRLVDLAQVVPSPVNVVEGVVGREGTGFRRGLNRTMGLAVAGTNPVAVDSVASYLMGFDPAGLLYLRLAAQAGLGSNDLGALTVFEVRDGVVVPCTDLAALRADPPFRVIREIRGEEEWIPPEA